MKIAFYGDSITEDDDGLYGVKAYPSYLKESLNIDYANRGVRGETLLQILNRVDKDDLNEFDVVSILGGNNDFLQGHTELDNYSSLISYMISYTCRQLKHKYPDIKVIICVPTRCWKLVDNEIHQSKRTDYDKYVECAKNEDATIIDLYDIVELSNPDNSMYTDTFEADGWVVHPNSSGHVFIARKFSEVLEKWQNM